jgi:arylsulfatase A-like enzyme
MVKTNMSSHLNRREFLANSLLAQSSRTKPNILVILVDDLGYGDLGSQGAKDIRSPNIDALSKSGMRFENFYANCPVCSPTRAALLSGMYPEMVGVPGVIRKQPDQNWGYLSPKATLLPVVLKNAGYATGIVGKWHLGYTGANTPNERGFDEFRGMRGDMLRSYYTHVGNGGTEVDMWHNTKQIDPKGHATDLFTNWAIELIEGWARGSKPFFLYLPFNAPHAPIEPPPEWLAKVTHPDEKRRKLIALIEHLDDAVGRVIAALKRSGQYENTLILFSSDNGGDCPVGANNGPWRGCKQEMYEGGIRVPACAVWPGRIAPGSRTEQIALSMDLAPTAAEAGGATFPDKLDGVSLLAILTGRATALPARDLFWTRREGNNAYMGLTIDAMRRGDWKLIHNTPFQPMELYNLRDDPYERNDLAKKNPKVFNEMAAELRRHIQRGGAVPWQAP